MNHQLFALKNLGKEFPIKKGFFGKKVGAVHAVHNVSLEIPQEETLGLVGESGCGKSTLARIMLLLLKPTQGQLLFQGQDITHLKGKQLKELRKNVQIIFQNPYSSLNPRFCIGDTIAEPLFVHKYGSQHTIQKRVQELMNMVGLPHNDYGRYPHEFSGGQRQRIVIARALALNPRFIIADEPVSALDVSIQAQIINLLNDLQKDLKLTYLFISHNLNVIHYTSTRVAVMYLGELVEIGLKDEIFNNYKHPYTEALLNAVLTGKEAHHQYKRIILEGDVPSPIHRPSGCFFHPRCQYAEDICRSAKPEYTCFSETHKALCHFPEKLTHEFGNRAKL